MALRTKPIALPDLADLDAGSQPRLLPVDLIDEDPEQPRREFDAESLGELAETIRSRGVRSPVSVRAHPFVPGRWILNFGARRLRASKLADRRDIPAFVDETFDSYDQVIENEQREGLKPLEIALFIERQLNRGHSRAEIARSIGKSQSYVTYACSLIDPPDWLLDLYRGGRCRGMLELHELRRMHETNASVVDAWLAGKESVGRSELQLLRELVAQASARPMQQADAAEDRAPSADAFVSTAPTAGPPVRTSPLVSNELRSRPLSSAAPAAILNQFKDVDVPSSLRSIIARRVAVLAQHDGATVHVVLDRLPDLPASVFVIDDKGSSRAVLVDALIEMRLSLESTPL